MIVRPRSEDSSCYYGRGTRWCISATQSRNYFDQYTGEGAGFYFVLFKHLPQDDEYKKLALVFTAGSSEPSEVFDVVDDEVGVDAVTDAVRFNIFAEALKKSKSEFAKFKHMAPSSAEASVVRTYLDCLVDVPWKKKSKVKTDIKASMEILEEDHYGLEEVKERIVEYLAVQKRVKSMKAPVLCLVGPPGVGKTSLGESIARATNRKFVRMSLGGVRDESEIRGHRRTYIGSMPGKIIQKLSKVGVKNPLFLLDEIDKIGMDHRGDPASALLEVLDPEQNNTFSDHYLEVDYDLSEVMFVCTANSLNIPTPLLDRMEIIRIPGYTDKEKNQIAQKYLVPKQLTNHGLKKTELRFNSKILNQIIRNFTREAGVRNLEKEISKVCRKTVKVIETSKKTKVSLDSKTLQTFLGVIKYRSNEIEKKNLVGITNGLA